MKRTIILAIALAALVVATFVSCNGNPKKTIELPTHIDVTERKTVTVGGVTTPSETTYTLDYTYDDNGRLTSKTKKEATYTERTEYTYDKKGNLKSWRVTDTNGKKETYTYVADLDWFQIIADYREDQDTALENKDLKFTDDGKLKSLKEVYINDGKEEKTATITIDYEPSTGLPTLFEEIISGEPSESNVYKYAYDSTSRTCTTTCYKDGKEDSFSTIRFRDGWKTPVSQTIVDEDIKAVREYKYNGFGIMVSYTHSRTESTFSETIKEAYDDYGFPKSYSNEYSHADGTSRTTTIEYKCTQTRKFKLSTWKPMVEKTPYADIL